MPTIYMGFFTNRVDSMLHDCQSNFISLLMLIFFTKTRNNGTVARKPRLLVLDVNYLYLAEIRCMFHVVIGHVSKWWLFPSCFICTGSIILFLLIVDRVSWNRRKHQAEASVHVIVRAGFLYKLYTFLFAYSLSDQILFRTFCTTHDQFYELCLNSLSLNSSASV